MGRKKTRNADYVDLHIFLEFMCSKPSMFMGNLPPKIGYHQRKGADNYGWLIGRMQCQNAPCDEDIWERIDGN